MPSSGLGKPSTDACGVVITEPHDTIGLMLHDGTYDGLSRISIFSTVSVAEAISPIDARDQHPPRAGQRYPHSRPTAAVSNRRLAHQIWLTPGRHDAAGVAAVSMPGTSPTISLILATNASGVDDS